MFNIVDKPSVTAATTSLALALMASFSHAQSSQEAASETTIQVVQFAGAMHATSINCGTYSEQTLREYKTQQQKKLAEQGMDEQTFEQAFAQGRRQAEQRWEGLSKQEQQQACKEIEDQASDMTPLGE